MVSSRKKYHIEDTFTLSGAKNLLIPGGVGIRSKPLRFEDGGSLENSYFFNLFSQFSITKPLGSSNKKLLKNEKAALVALKKILQRGDNSFLSPEVECALLKKYGFEYTTNSEKGDVSPILSSEPIIIDGVFDLTQESKFKPRAIISVNDTRIFDSKPEREFYSYCEKNFPTSIKWLQPQPKREYFVNESYKEEISKEFERGVDFLYSPPWQKPVIIEILGPHHFLGNENKDLAEESTKFQKYKDRFNSELVDVYGIPVSQIENKNGPDFELVTELLKTPKQIENKTVSNFLKTLWSIGALQNLMPELIETEKLYNKKSWKIKINSFDSLTGFNFFLNMVYSVLKIWDCDTLLPKDIVFFREESDKVRLFSRDENGRYKKINTQQNTAFSTKEDVSIFVEYENTYLEKYNSNKAYYARKSNFPFKLQNTIGKLKKPKLTIDDTHKKYLEELLKYIFGKKQFREVQFSAIKNVLEGLSSLVLLPTGFGKSMIYQLASFILPGVTIIISPTVALIKNQQENLEANSITRAVGLSGEDSPLSRDLKYSDISKGDTFIILCSPERLLSPDFTDAMKQAVSNIGISLNTIDEAHCISEWGQEFRTAYLGIGDRLASLSNNKVPLLAVTGTASLKVRQDIVFNCNLKENNVLQAQDYRRPELEFQVLNNDKPNDKTNKLKYFFDNSLVGFLSDNLLKIFENKINETDNNLILIFVPYKNDLIFLRRELNAFFKNKNIDVDIGMMWGTRPIRKKQFEKAGVGEDQKAYKKISVDDFKAGRKKVMIATKAFGMGIDIPNIRSVVHYGIPSSLMSWYQEAGRGGRDQEKSLCYTIYTEEHGIIPEELFTDYDSSVVEDVGQKIGKSDIWTHLSFYYNSFPGIYEELLYLIDFLRKLNEEHKYNPYVQNQNATLPFFGEVSEWKISGDKGYMSEDDEIQAENDVLEAETYNSFIDKTIYRLMICGILKTWHKDYSKKQYILELNDIKNIVKFEDLEKWLSQRLHTTTKGFIDNLKEISKDIEKKNYQDVIDEFIDKVVKPDEFNTDEIIDESTFNIKDLNKLGEILIKPPNSPTEKRIANLEKQISYKDLDKEQKIRLDEVLQAEWFSKELEKKVMSELSNKYNILTKNKREKLPTPEQLDSIEKIKMSSPSDAFKKKFRSFKAKNMHDVDWFYLEKLLYEEGEDSSYNTKIKMQKKYKSFEKKASGMDAFIICIFSYLVKATYDSIGYQKRVNHLNVYKFAKDNSTNEEIQEAFDNFFGDVDTVFASKLKDELMNPLNAENVTLKNWIDTLKNVPDISNIFSDIEKGRDTADQFSLWWVGYLYVLIQTENKDADIRTHLNLYKSTHADSLHQLIHFLKEYKRELNSAAISLILDWIESSYDNEKSIEDLEQYQKLKDSHINEILQNDNFDEHSLAFLNNNLLTALKEKIYN